VCKARSAARPGSATGTCRETTNCVSLRLLLEASASGKRQSARAVRGPSTRPEFLALEAGESSEAVDDVLGDASTMVLALPSPESPDPRVKVLDKSDCLRVLLVRCRARAKGACP
jgi:hypothetical protein